MNEQLDRLDQIAEALLDDLPAWRVRAVERIELSSAFWSEREREIHVRPFRELTGAEEGSSGGLRADMFRPGLRRRSDGREEVELLLPIKELPDIPLLDLHISVAGKDVYRVPKSESARIQASHIITLANRAGFMVTDKPPHLRDFLASLFHFPSHSYEEICREFEDDLPDDWEYEYLRAEFPHLPDSVYDKWKYAAREIKRLAPAYALPHLWSGAENPLLAFPHFFQVMRKRKNPVNLSRRDFTAHLNYLSRVLIEAHEVATSEL